MKQCYLNFYEDTVFLKNSPFTPSSLFLFSALCESELDLSAAVGYFLLFVSVFSVSGFC